MDCVDGSSLSIVDGELRHDPARTSAVLLYQRSFGARYYGFSHTSEPSPQVAHNHNWSDQVTWPADYGLVALARIGDSSMGTSSRNGGVFTVSAALGLADAPDAGTGSVYPVWAFGTRYDAGTDFIWRNQGVVETATPGVIVDIPLRWVGTHEPVVSTVGRDVPFLNGRVVVEWSSLGWNSGGFDSGTDPLNYANSPDVTVELWGFPVL